MQGKVNTQVDYDELQALVSEHGWPVSAAELHGFLTGLVSLGLHGSDSPKPSAWFEQFLHDYSPSQAKPLDESEQGMLHNLWLATTQGIESEDFGFSLALPDDDASLILRVLFLNK